MLKEFMLLTTIIFTTPEKEMTAVVLSEPFEHKAACEERIDRHPFIDFALSLIHISEPTRPY